MSRSGVRRGLIALCVGAVLWAIVLALTSGISLPLGPVRLSSHSPRGPLVLAIVAGLAAWVLAMPTGAAVPPVARAPRRGRAIALIGLMLLGLNVLTLGQPPLATDQDYCMSDNVLGKGFRHIFVCDTVLFLILAQDPAAVLVDPVRQSRPLSFGLAHVVAQPLYLVPRLPKYGPYRPFGPEFVAYLIINLALLMLTAVTFAWLSTGTARLESSPELMFGIVVLGVNDVTKIFFWNPHVQLYNLFIPCLTMWLVCRGVQRGGPMRAPQAAALGWALGLGFLVYGAFLIPVLCVSALEVLRYRKLRPALLILATSIATYGIWVAFVVAVNGSFYSHEVHQYRQFVWLLDCAALGAGACAPIVAHNLQTFFNTSAPVLLVPLALLFGLRVARIIWTPSGTASEAMTQPVAVAIGTTAVVTTAFLALMGFYAQRLTWLLVPPIVVAMALELRAWRVATPRAGWWRFNWAVLVVCLVYIGVVVARQGPYR